MHRREVRKKPAVAEANRRALKAGYNYGETTEMFASQYRSSQAEAAAGHVPQHHRQRGHWPGA